MIELTEYIPVELPCSHLSNELGEMLWTQYHEYVSVDFPSPKTKHQWRLKNRGWVGYLPMPGDMCVVLKPKMPLKNLFGMLEYAYRLKSIKFLKGFVECDSLEEFYSRLANVLARNIQDRARIGLYRDYVSHTDSLSYICGRMDLSSLIRRPWSVNPRCEYQDHTANIQDNQILLWTLSRIALSGACKEQALANVRRAYRVVSRGVEIVPCHHRDCLNRLYNRLNADYQPLHALCQFFLEHSGPSVNIGGHQMIPFLVNMPRLFEQFVAEWLRSHLPDNLLLEVQYRVDIDMGTSLHFDMDLVLLDSSTERPLIVCDTKYKITDKPSSDDIQQIVAYAYSLGCKEAVLVYPYSQIIPIDKYVKEIRVRTLSFSIEGGIEEAGERFLSQLLETSIVASA